MGVLPHPVHPFACAPSPPLSHAQLLSVLLAQLPKPLYTPGVGGGKEESEEESEEEESEEEEESHANRAISAMASFEPCYCIARFRTQKKLKGGKGGGYMVNLPHSHTPHTHMLFRSPPRAARLLAR